MSANEKQVGGDHYKSTIQHWDYVIANDLDYFQAQITKYVARWRKKGGLPDLEKAKHFLEKYIETETAKHEKMMQKTCAEIMASPHRIGTTDALAAPKSPGVMEQFRNRVMPPKVQTLAERLPDLTGQKNPRGYDPNEEQF